jgi:hypothetical protein
MNSGAREEETVPASYYTQSSYIYTVNLELAPVQWFSRQSSAAKAKATQIRLCCSYVVPISLCKFYCLLYNLVDRYEIFISQVTMGLLLFT